MKHKKHNTKTNRNMYLLKAIYDNQNMIRSAYTGFIMYTNISKVLKDALKNTLSLESKYEIET